MNKPKNVGEIETSTGKVSKNKLKRNNNSEFSY